MEELGVTQTTAWGDVFTHPTSVEVTITKPSTEQLTPNVSGSNAGITGFLSQPRVDYNRSASFTATDSYNPTADEEEDDDDDGTGKKPGETNGRRCAGLLLTNVQRVKAVAKLSRVTRRGPFTSPAFRLGPLTRTL